ncbi:MAG: NAD+ synthase, partial [Planctomycetes bacterium]|nr:NAD+ synthase [Planctomycetota bacterium]
MFSGGAGDESVASVKIALAQINPTIGDFDGTVAKVATTTARARALGADLVVFPEQALTGYPARDLLERPTFVDANLRALERVTSSCRGIGVVLGFVGRHRGDGRPLTNSAALIDDGLVRAVIDKTLLPTYDVFDEDRYFEPGGPAQTVAFRGRKLGVTICEDLWTDPTLFPRRRYHHDPALALRKAGADLIVNLSASPFHLGKADLRADLARRQAARLGAPVILVNQVGANDELIFDGSSLAAFPDGTTRLMLRSFEEDLGIIDLDAPPPVVARQPPDEAEEAVEALTLGIRDYARKCGFTRVTLGLSGGVDSAVVAALAARAIGPRRVLGLAMPSRFSSPGSLDDARSLAERLGIEFMV